MSDNRPGGAAEHSERLDQGSHSCRGGRDQGVPLEHLGGGKGGRDGLTNSPRNGGTQPPQSKAALKRRQKQNATAFHYFFLEGCTGFTLFPRIRAFLAVQDFVTCGKAGKIMQRKKTCATYTVQNILSQIASSITRQQCIDRDQCKQEREKILKWPTTKEVLEASECSSLRSTS